MTFLPSHPLPPDLVACLERADEVMEKKPGLARDLLLDRAAELGISDPHLVPPFLEEGARIALYSEQLPTVRQLFAKASEARQTHGLLVDEEHHRRVFRELISHGALGATELTAEATSLLQRCPTGEALDYFIGLIVDRARIGIPPYPRLADDVRRLIEAARADRVVVENRLLRDLLETAYLSQTPEDFWKAYRDRLVSLARQDPQVRSALFELNPTEVESDTWIDLIESTGIVDDLRSRSRDAIAWLTRFVDSRWHYTYWNRLSRLVRTLPLAGATVRFKHPVTPELCDALLEAGADVPEELFPTWFNGWIDGDNRPDLIHLARSPFSRRSLPALVGLLREHAEVLLAHEGSRAMLGSWLGSVVDESSTMLTALEGLRAVRPLCSSQGHALFPEQMSRLLQLCAGPRLLAEAFHDGMLTEYTWPALEATVAELHRDDPTAAITFHESGTAVGVAARGRVIWLDGDQRIAEARFHQPRLGARPQHWRYVLNGTVTGCHWLRGSTWCLTWSDDLETHRETPPPEPPAAKAGRAALPGVGESWWIDEDGGLHRKDDQLLFPAQDEFGNTHVLHHVPLSSWRWFRTRDAAVSARLRAATPEDVTSLMNAVPETELQYGRFSTWPTSREPITPDVRAAAEKLLGTTDPALTNAAVWLACRVKALATWAADLLTPPTQKPVTMSLPGPSLKVVEWLDHGSSASTREQLIKVRRALAGENVTVGMLPQLEYLPLVMPEVVLALASVPLLDRDVVAGAAAAVAAVIDSGLYSPDAVIFAFERTRDMPVHHPGSLIETPTGPAMFLQMTGGSYEMTVYSPGGGVPDHVDGAPTTVLLRAQGIPAEKVTAAFQTLLSAGAPEWRPDKAARLAEGLGWLRGTVALLLGGPRNFTTWKSDFLPKEVRVLLGLTPKEAHMARAFLRDQDPLQLMKILAAGARDPERVVAEGPDVDAIIEDFGLGEDAIRFPEEIVLAAGQEFPYAGVKKLEELRSSEKLEKSLISTWLWLTTRLRRDDPLRVWLAGRLDDFESGFEPSPYRAIQADLRVPGDGWSQDPLVTAPEIVAEVAARFGIPEDPARYWLQLLALHNPTDTNIALWNGWRKAEREWAAAPLLEQDLIVRAKRARAGRSLFLPGGWQEAKTPYLPMESWKASFYDLKATPQVLPQLLVVVPSVPFGQLFTDAWRRCTSGDVPGP